jgi:hypothetical protein
METKERTSPITGKEGAEIELHVAAEWTKNHRRRNRGGIISQFFGIEILQRLLQQPGCLGIRIYYANSKSINGWQRFILAIANFLVKVVGDAEGEMHFILTGVTKEGFDQIPGPHPDPSPGAAPQIFQSNVAGVGAQPQSILVEQAHPCPGSVGCPQNALTNS